MSQKQNPPIESFAPLFTPENYGAREHAYLAPFFTNLDTSVYALAGLPPELVGALCSRASRAQGDLRTIFLKEYILPFLKPERSEKDTDESIAEKIRYGKALKSFLSFLKKHSFADLFANPRARAFYTTWLAQYGDDSIAQMAGTHLAFSGISQIAIKHLEDQRIGLAPIEKSTRYADYTQKINGQYLYYTDPTLKTFVVEKQYRGAMDNLFETNARLIEKLKAWLVKRFPDEKPGVIEKKAFDTLRGLLPLATLSQVAFFGNGQAFEYLVNRCMKHSLGEIRWVGARAYEELFRVTPSFLRRVEKEETQEYQNYLAERRNRRVPGPKKRSPESEEIVRLVEWDPDGENKVIAGILFDAPGVHTSWEACLQKASLMTDSEKRNIIKDYLPNRTARWQRVGRAFENAYVRFEIIMNIGAWRDLHRHRMLTQQRQEFSCDHGFDIPPDVKEAGLEKEFTSAIERAEDAYNAIAKHGRGLAQYAITLAHRMRFMQWENLRECFWEMELRTIPEGHPDYRRIEQKKFALLAKKYPLIAEHMLVNVGQYDFARRGQEEKIQKKLKDMSE